MTTNYTIVSFAVDPRHLATFRTIAKRQGQSRSALMRRSMLEFINRERRQRLTEKALIRSTSEPAAPARAVAVA